MSASSRPLHAEPWNDCVEQYAPDHFNLSHVTQCASATNDYISRIASDFTEVYTCATLVDRWPSKQLKRNHVQ